MRITELFQNGRPFPSLEIVPPLGGMTKEDLLSSIEPLMEFSPRYINVTTHRDEFSFEKQADGSFRRRIVNSRVSPVAVCACIQARFPVEVVPHIICGGQTATDIRRQLQDFRFMGIDNVMALRGDSTIGEKRFTPTEEGYTHASQLVSAIHEEGPFCVGVGGYPEKHFEAPNMETDIANLKKKVDAGADYIITQMFFDNQVFFRFVKLGRHHGPHHPGPEAADQSQAGEGAPRDLLHRPPARPYRGGGEGRGGCRGGQAPGHPVVHRPVPRTPFQRGSGRPFLHDEPVRLRSPGASQLFLSRILLRKT